MPQRSPVDLSHFCFQKGQIGNLQTLAAIPVYAGDSVSVNIEGIWRLSPLRRNLIVDAHVDMFAFYVPHRHIYGEDWIQFIKDGKSSTFQFPTVDTPTGAVLEYLGMTHNANKTLPLWLPAAYNRIWNRYFRSPSDDQRLRADDYLTGDGNERSNGFLCGYLPQPWSTGVILGVSETEREVPVVLDTFDIVDLNRVQAEYKTEVDRTYFGERYNDILNTTWGATVNTDADERPTLCAHKVWWLSGYDVDATDDAALGSYSGKSAGVGQFTMPRKYFAEHGSLWLMSLMRFPNIHTEERHFLMNNPSPSYLEWGADASLVAAEPPIPLIQSDFFNVDTGAQYGFGPFGQWYRYHTNRVHSDYKVLDGFSFLDEDMTSHDRVSYHNSGEYDDVFQTTQLGHWQANARIGVKAQRTVPPGRTSLFAGV